MNHRLRNFVISLAIIGSLAIVHTLSVNAAGNPFATLTADKETVLANGQDVQSATLTIHLNTSAPATADDARIQINPNGPARGYFRYTAGIGFYEYGDIVSSGNMFVTLLPPNIQNPEAGSELRLDTSNPEDPTATFIFRWTLDKTYGAISNNTFRFGYHVSGINYFGNWQAPTNDGRITFAGDPQGYVAATDGGFGVTKTSVVVGEMQSTQVIITTDHPDAITDVQAYINMPGGLSTNAPQGWFEWDPLLKFQERGNVLYGNNTVELLNQGPNASTRTVASDGKTVTFQFNWLINASVGATTHNVISYRWREGNYASSWLATDVRTNQVVSFDTILTPPVVVGTLQITTPEVSTIASYTGLTTDATCANVILDATNSTEDIRITQLQIRDVPTDGAKVGDLRNLRLLVDRDGDSGNDAGTPTALSNIQQGTQTEANTPADIIFDLNSADQFTVKAKHRLNVALLCDFPDDGAAGTHQFFTDLSSQFHAVGVTSNMNIFALMNINSLYKNIISYVPHFVWSPQSIAGLELWVHSHGLAHMFKEDGSIQGLTPVTQITDPVGSIESPVNAHTISALGAAGRPTLTSGNGANSALLFSSAGNGNMLTVKNSQTAFRFIQGTGIATIVIHASVSADGVAYTLLDSNAGTTANAGLLIERTTGNKIRLLVTKGVAGSSVFNYTTNTSTLRAIDGVVPIVISLNNASGGSIQIGTQPAESFARLSTPLDALSASDLAIGRQFGGGNKLDGTIQDIFIFSGPVSATNITALQSWNPMSTAASMVSEVGAENGWYNFLDTWLDFTDTSTLYQDNTRTAHVSATNDPISLVEHKLDPGGHLNRAATATSTDNRPLWISETMGGDWDGINDNLTFHAFNRNTQNTIIIVGMNRDNVYGSHFLSSSGSRILVTGTNYTGNQPPGGPGAPYMIVHPGLGATSYNLLTHPAIGGWNLLEIRRDGPTWTQSIAGTNVSTAVNDTVLSINNMGMQQLPNWALNGEVRMVLKFNAILTDDQMARIRTDLMARFSDL